MHEKSANVKSKKCTTN